VRRLLALRTAAVRAGFAAGSLRALRPRIVLASGHAAALSGNLAFIADELAARHPEVRVTVLVTRPARGLRGRLAALLFAVRAGYQLASARVLVVDDYFFALYVIRPRRGTFRLQVWHAAGAFKKFGYSVVDKDFGADEAYLRRVRIHSNYSLALVSSASVAPHYAEAFGQPVSLFTARYGIPRTDLFFDDRRRAAAKERLRDRYGLPDGRRVILYAPTFRGETVGKARYDDLLDLAAMHEVLGDDHVVLLRLHPFVGRRVAVPAGLAGFVIDASGDPDINELMLVSDLLVTDYSSAIYEFALLGRPILFLAPDDTAYERERGFYLDFPADLPGPVFTTAGDLAAAIRSGAFDLDRVRRFASASFDVADGRSTARVVEELLLPAVEGRPPDGDAQPRVAPG
jgi:teichoic acid ribitol-phosphate primase